MHSSIRIAGVAVAVCLTALPALGLAQAVRPTAEEQLMLELLNRARADPEAEARRLEIDLNEGLEPGTISAEPKQPLAFHPALIEAARGHSRWVLESEEFSHTGADETLPQDRIEASDYPLGDGSWSTGENLAFHATSEELELPEAVQLLHDSLFINEGIPDRSHRQAMMNDEFHEAGIGIKTGTWTEEGRELNAVMATQKFAQAQERGPFLTGVVFRDREGEGFYTLDDGIGGVEITAVRREDRVVSSARTVPSGGYTLKLRPGIYDVRFRNPETGRDHREYGIRIDKRNVKVDWTIAPGETTE